MAKNQAAWLDGAGKPLRVGDADMPTAEAGYVVVRNHAIAVNPVEYKVQDTGIMVQNWPIVLGNDIAGEIVEVGPDVKGFSKGDRVMAHGFALITQKQAHGCFALYSAVTAGTTSKIPDNMSFNDAVVLPLALDTAAVGLILPTSDGFFGLPLPSLNPSSIGKTLIVYGGSSSVGALAIQLAVASGVKVIATSSPNNFDLCKRAGASEVFDYKSPSLVKDLASAVKSVGGDFIGVYDAISLDIAKTGEIVESLGGGRLIVVLRSASDVTPGGTKVGKVFGVNTVTHPIWADWVLPALEKGQLKCLPEPVVVGRGLESIQKGIDMSRKGVSGQKVVIEL